MSAYLTIEFMPGDNIENAFKEAVDIATRLKINVQFKFNDTACIARPNGNPENGVKEYHATLPNKYPFASA